MHSRTVLHTDSALLALFLFCLWLTGSGITCLNVADVDAKLLGVFGFEFAISL
jgi:hypothetical protein